MKPDEILNNIYFIKKGEFAGCFPAFLTFDEKKQLYSVLLLPECQSIFISQTEINNYIQSGLVDFIEKLPEDVVKESLMEFTHRLTNS